MKNEIVGTGITARLISYADVKNKGDIKKIRDNFEGWNDDIKEGGGIFGAVSLLAHKYCKSILEKSTEDPPYLRDSVEGFASIILSEIKAAKYEIENGNADIAARHAYCAGYEMARAEMKWKWEYYALSGKTTFDNLSTKRKEHNANRKLGAETRRAHIATLLKTTSTTGGALEKFCQKKLLAQHGIKVSTRTIRRDINLIRK